MGNSDKEPQKQPPHTYVMYASRGTSGLNGKYESIDVAIHQLQEYSKSFPGEIVSVSITKVNKSYDSINI
jgi:hypothetical protein